MLDLFCYLVSILLVYRTFLTKLRFLKTKVAMIAITRNSWNLRENNCEEPLIMDNISRTRRIMEKIFNA